MFSTVVSWLIVDTPVHKVTMSAILVLPAMLKLYRQMDEPKNSSSPYKHKQQNGVFGKSSVFQKGFGDLKVSGRLVEQTNLMKRDLFLHISCIVGGVISSVAVDKKKYHGNKMCCNVNAISQRLHE